MRQAQEVKLADKIYQTQIDSKRGASPQLRTKASEAPENRSLNLEAAPAFPGAADMRCEGFSDCYGCPGGSHSVPIPAVGMSGARFMWGNQGRENRGGKIETAVWFNASSEDAGPDCDNGLIKKRANGNHLHLAKNFGYERRMTSGKISESQKNQTRGEIDSDEE